ncbi:PKD domain-containing protein [Chitinophaga pinensis]|uniref:PKD domain containing protein n=1 Tax=Chitinophaga pinensis (strain ATCC 43595 / DSM 2588 / LMG 13176 / NBRC 15968 / NCIMB 11800 / UQM 2034) TaxID=485918 RepID=A0A979GVM2_CHIPD|nr:PKD domain-containing protein [Chitinophaga pinensis]ACU61176.1 PKD domain containing protein [Chitinophaga pinensis DSM 2588]
MKHLYTIAMFRKLAACLAVTLFTTLTVAAQQTAVSLAGTKVTNSGGYYEYVPPSYAASKDSFPLLIFIHGIGELGNGTSNLPAVLRNGVPKLIDKGLFPASFKVGGKSFSFIVASPQFRNIPSPMDVLSLVNYLKGKFRIDSKRIYVTGLSMGGGATEDFASANDSYAQIPAAVVAVAGNMNPLQITNAPKVMAKNDVPVWFLHNENDPVVPSQYSKDWTSMMDSYKPSPTPQPKLTIFNASGHDAWSKAYDPSYKEDGLNVYEWMLQYEKGGKVSTPSKPNPGNKRVNAKPNIGNGMYYPDAMTAFGLTPGDTLCIPAGDYEFIQLGSLVGTAAKPIVITNCGGVVRTGIRTLKTDVSFNIMGGKFLHITGSGTPGVEYGFDINGRNLLGIKMQGIYLGSGSSDIDIHNFYVHDVGSFMVAKTTQECTNPQFWEGKYVMKNVKIHHIKGRYSDYEGFYIGNTHYVMDYLLCQGIKSHHIQDLEVYDNDLQYMGQDGIQISMCDLGENKIHHNIVRNYGTTKLDAQSYGMLMGGGSRVKLYNNVVDNGYLPGIALFGSGISYVYNNVISNVENGEGINVSDKLILEPVTGYIYNNTIYNTGNTGIKIYAYLTTIGHKVYNNLVIEKAAGGSYPTDGLYIRGAQNIKFDYGNNMFSTTANAGKVVTNVNGADFHLTTASTAVDAGKSVADLGLITDMDDLKRPVNSGYDVGAYEYQLPKAPSTGNVKPTANAGKDLTITLPTNTVTLDGTGSTDTDGKISKYLWTKQSGPAGGTITNNATASTSVTGLTAGTYIFTLTVTDDKSATDIDSVTVKVNAAAANKPPVSNPGSAVIITLPTNTVTLDGAGSADGDGKINKYEWKKVSGPAAGTITTPAAVKTTITGLTAGAYVFSLTVTDDKQSANTSTVSVTVNPAANKAPVANAGKAVNITLPTNNATLDGSASSDTDGKISKYEWKKVSGPATGTITTPAAVKTTITGLTAGTYVFSLTVTDDKQTSNTATVTVTVNPATNKLPVAVPGNAQTITLPTNSVTVDGQASYDPDGKITKYLWQRMSGPNDVTFSNASAAKTTISGMIAGTYVFSLSVADDDGAVAAANITITVNPAANKAPVANAGSAQTITLPTNVVTLDGKASSDADGSISKYEWKKVSGPASGTIATPATVKTAITGLTAGTYVFSLTVTDNRQATSTANVTVKVNPAPNKAPVANAGSAQTITLPTNTVTLDGKASSDADGSIAKYEWKKVSGPATGTIATPATVKTAITGLTAGTYVFSLTVTDNSGAVATSNVTVTVNPAPNKAPVANAGSAVTITLPTSTVTLDGKASSDADGSIAKYAWKKVSGPNGGAITTPAAVKTTITGLTAGTYVYALTVTDNDGASATANVTITVKAAPAANKKPIANAGPDVTITLPENSALLDGSLSMDPDGKIAKYEWYKISGPNGGTIKVKDAAITNAQLLIEGTYLLALQVTDNSGATDIDTMKLVVKAAPPAVNAPPVARAGNDITVRLPVNSVILNGAASSDPDGIVTNYQWLKISGKDVHFSNATGIINVVSGLTPGTYVIELQVTDNKNAKASDRLTITVLAAENSDGKPPVVLTQGDLTLRLPNASMKADGSRSYANGTNISSYAWKQVYGPLQATIAAPSAKATDISGMNFPGSYVFELTVTDDKKQSSRATFEVTVLEPGGDAFVPEITTYPNPVVTALTFKQRMKNSSQGTITIFNIAGKAMKSYNLPAGENIQQTLDVSTLPIGTYILQVIYKNNNYKWSTKFVKSE